MRDGNLHEVNQARAKGHLMPYQDKIQGEDGHSLRAEIFKG